MNLITFPVAVMAVLALYISVNRIWMFLLNRSNKVSLYFSLVCFLIFVYDLAAFQVYTSSSLQEGIFWERVEFFIGAWFALSYFMFIYTIFGKKNRFTYLYFIAIALLSFSSWIDSPLFLHETRVVERTLSFLGKEIHFQEALPGIFVNILYGLIIIAMSITLFYIAVGVLLEKKTNMVPLFITSSLFFISGLSDILIGMGVYSFIYTIEYSFLLLIFAMDYILVRDYNNLLQHMEFTVNKRTMELQEANKKLNDLANIDTLTGIYNRRYFEKAYPNECSRHARSSLPISVMLCDIDFFKKYNDTYGHQAGDACLNQIAQSLAHSINRPADFCARYGGEEFIIVLPQTDKKGAVLIADKIMKNISLLAIPHKASLVSDRITCSIGITTKIPNKTMCSDFIVREADKALYKAKNMGRNRFVVTPD